MLNNKIVFVTGGTGSFGKYFVKQALEKYNLKKIIIYSRDELKQFDMAQDPFFKKYEKKIRYFIGDIRDISRLKFAMKDSDIVIHSAALKQVNTGEYNPFEFIKTNITGTQNIIDCALNSNVTNLIGLSTDKASSPINLYGATKLCSDKLILSANNYSGKRKIKFSVVRYGNVMGSRGSVINTFIDIKKKEKIIPITSKEMTRFNITLDQGVNFVLKCLTIMQGGEIFVPKILSYKILDLKKAIAPNLKIKIIGLRQGEKTHESLISENEAMNVFEYKDYFVIIENFIIQNKKIKKYHNDLLSKKCQKVKKNFSYTSDNNKFLSVEKIKNLIAHNLQK